MLEAAVPRQRLECCLERRESHLVQVAQVQNGVHAEEHAGGERRGRCVASLYQPRVLQHLPRQRQPASERGRGGCGTASRQGRRRTPSSVIRFAGSFSSMRDARSRAPSERSLRHRSRASQWRVLR